MTLQKDLKKKIREEAERTGESYATVRQRLIKQVPPAPKTPQPHQSLVLPRKTAPGLPLRIGQLSWDRQPDTILPTVSFLTHLTQACRASTSVPADLIQCAGYPLEKAPDATELLRASQGQSVLLEVRNSDGTARWLAVFERSGVPRISIVRHSQLVRSSEDPKGDYDSLIDALEDGAGIFSFDGLDIPFVFLICGENNALGYHLDARSSLWYVEASTKLHKVIRGKWVAVNSSHLAYWPHSRMTGFAKVGMVGNAGPVLGKNLVAYDAPYPDGSRSPSALLHCNNWLSSPDNPDTGPRTMPYSSVIFARDPSYRRVPPLLDVIDPHRRWRYVVTELSV